MEPRIGVTLGDPAGVGAELVLRLLRELGPDAPVTVFGSDVQLVAAAPWVGMSAPLPARILPASAAESPDAYSGGAVLLDLAPLKPEDVRPAVQTTAGAAAQLKYLSAAEAAARAGRLAGIVTGPVNKAAISSVMGARFVGQTELLARLAGLHAGDVAMAFTGDRIRTVLVTTHLALGAVPRAIKAERIERVVRLEVAHLEELGVQRPRLAVAGLNPHAGEGGLFGDEEHQVIGPAVGAIQARFKEEEMRATLVGPVPADAAFRAQLEGKVHAVVAMYHDQATIACKLVAFGETVNVTLGLPYVRTGVDHGTAYDIAGTGRADPRGIVAAWKLARKLVRRRAAQGR